MRNKLYDLLHKNRETVSYLFFGAATTIVNFAVYYSLYNFCHFSAAVCNASAWFLAVVFAFVTNKRFVFRSIDWTAKTVIPEALKFSACRIGSGLIETGLLFFVADILNWNGNVWKLLTSILVVVLNYIGSKLLVFRK